MGPGGSGKELVGKGSGTARARLAWAQFYKRNPFKRNFWKAPKFAQKSEGGQFYKRNPFKQIFWNNQNFAQIGKKMFKKDVQRVVFWNTLLLAWFLKNTFPHKSFKNKIQTLQLEIKFWNP